MAPALEAYAAAAEQVSTSEPTATLLSNRDGQPVTSAAQAMEYLVAQLTRPVRWDLCTETLRAREVTAIVEFPPAGTLAGIAKRELRGRRRTLSRPRRSGRAARVLTPAPKAAQPDTQ